MDATRFGVVGSGSIGLYYGACLARAGYHVRFLMRSGFQEAQKHGIRVLSDSQGHFCLSHPQVFDKPAAMGPVDVVIVALKMTSSTAIPDLVAPLLHPDSLILTLQNGLGADSQLAGQFGQQRILGGLCFVCLTRETAASVRHMGHGTLTLGRCDGPRDSRLEEIASAFEKAGIETEITDRLAEARWRKLVWNIPFNGLAIARGRISVDQILQNDAYRAETRALMDETLTAARALGHPIESGWMDFQIERTYSMGAYRPSSLIDFDAGRPVEVEAIWGEPLREAERVGIDTPHLKRLYQELKRLCVPESSTSENGKLGTLPNS